MNLLNIIKSNKCKNYIFGGKYPVGKGWGWPRPTLSPKTRAILANPTQYYSSYPHPYPI